MRSRKGFPIRLSAGPFLLRCVDLTTFAFLLVLVFFVAFIYSNLGLGGGLLYVPLMLWLAVDDHTIVVPISLTLTAATGVPSVYNHWKKGLVDVRLGKLLIAGTLLGTITGVAFSLQLETSQFKVFFLAVLLVFGTRTLLELRRRSDSLEEDDDSKLRISGIRRARAFSVLSGFLSGSSGVGGGLINVPILVSILGRSARKAIGTSALIIIPTSILGFLTYLVFNQWIPEEFVLILFLVPIVLMASFLGSRFGLTRLKTSWVAGIFIFILYATAVKILIDMWPR